MSLLSSNFMLRVDLALLGVVLSTRPCPQLLWWWRDKQQTWVTFRCLLMVVHVSPLSFPHWGSSVVRVGCLMLWPVRLVTEPASRAVMVSGWTVATTSASGVGASVPSSISGADAWHVSPLGHYLQDKGGSLLVRTNLVKKTNTEHTQDPLVFYFHFQTGSGVMSSTHGKI